MQVQHIKMPKGSPGVSHSDTCIDERNVPPVGQDMELSLYSSSNYEDSSHHKTSVQKRSLKEHNSHDSGYGSGCLGDNSKHIQTSECCSQAGRPILKNLNRSFKTMDSLDEEFVDFCDLAESLNKSSELPSDFDTLINGSFTPPTNQQKITAGNDLPIVSLPQNSHLLSTPNSSKMRVSSTATKANDIQFMPYKRPKCLETIEPAETYSRILEETLVPVLQKNILTTEDSIKFALQKSSTEPNLIGDFSKPYSLPLISGRNQDLKSISPETLALLIKGEFNYLVTSYKIIDCRYPYEFKGGHINGAINIFTKDQLLENLLHTNVASTNTRTTQKGHILIFHCEFSSNRAPNLYRFLRNYDRNCNKRMYPALHYPEVYLLEGGYKKFYEQHVELCEPQAYVPMSHPEHHDEFQYFKEKPKAVSVNRSQQNNQNSFKRLDFN